ncbi:MAG: hypothetical protein ACT6S0_26715, partial [Roseateles sp.]|uniref:hypothetical protein n=1 Tax=Roseateles sp. TaxID=1971397 RepID=UPI0040355454
MRLEVHPSGKRKSLSGGPPGRLFSFARMAGTPSLARAPTTRRMFRLASEADGFSTLKLEKNMMNKVHVNVGTIGHVD